eukprot:SAG31_NODE_7640_length_1633_cov_1.318123_2_plen_159_part_00
MSAQTTRPPSEPLQPSQAEFERPKRSGNLPPVPRIYTLFIYLTDVPEGHGGQTYFPMADPLEPEGTPPEQDTKACKFAPSWDRVVERPTLKCGLAVTPAKYKAVLWPDTELDHLGAAHPRTEHMALPIFNCTTCIKWAANVWIHLHDFKAAHLQGRGG